MRTTPTVKTAAPIGSGAPVPSVELENVSKHYGSVRALDEVSLRVADGEFVTLLGPSGSGKTTCLQIIAGIAGLDGGLIRIAGEDVRRQPMHKRNIGMVFQNYALFPNMTVAQNVLYPLRIRNWSKDRATEAMREALRLVRLHAHEDRRPDQLSGGQQQRVALARAIVFNPSVLLLDEPLSALDRLLREEMQLELRRVHELTGMATVCVTHDRSEALTMSDRVILLDGGKIVQSGTPREMYDRSATLFAAQFLGEVNKLRMRLSGPSGAQELVDDAGRRIAGIRPWNRVDDGPVDVAVRVENVRLAPAAGHSASSGAWTGVIEDVVFLGDGYRYRVASGSSSLVARAPRGASGSALEIGDTVEVSFDAADVMVFPVGAEGGR